MAALGGSTFWFSSQAVSALIPVYLAAGLALEAGQLFAVFAFQRGRLPHAFGDLEARLVGWGGYQLLCGLTLLQIFGDIDLWLGSLVPVYVGFAALIMGVVMMVRKRAVIG